MNTSAAIERNVVNVSPDSLFVRRVLCPIWEGNRTPPHISVQIGKIIACLKHLSNGKSPIVLTSATVIGL